MPRLWKGHFADKPMTSDVRASEGTAGELTITARSGMRDTRRRGRSKMFGYLSTDEYQG